MLRIKILSVGSLQLHLTQMKQAHIEGTLADWNEAALAIIRTALKAREAAWGINTNATQTLRNLRPSLVTATPSANGSGRSSGEADGRVDGVDGGINDVAAGRRGQSLFRRVASFAQMNSWGGDEQEAERENEGRDAGAVQDRTEPAGGRGQSLLRRAASYARINSWGAYQQQVEEEGEGGHAGALQPSSGSVNGDVDGDGGDGGDDGDDGDEKVEVARADLVGLLADEPQEGRVMEALLVTSEDVIADVGAQEEGIPLLLGNVAPPSRLRRNWSLFAVATPAVLAVALFMYANRSGIRRSLFMVRGSLRQFVREHISEPFWGIYNELVHNQPLTMTDANALADSSLSLERMLEAFIKDTRPELPLAEVKRMAATKDMSVVSREYETSIISAWKNLVAGDIARMVQFIKRELLIATTAIGQLARENELNLRMMATVPAFLLAWGSFRAVRPVYYLLKAEKSRDSTFTAMRTIVLAMERLLNLRHREGTWLQLTEDLPTGDAVRTQAGDRTARRRGSLFRPSGHSDNCTSQVIVSAGEGQGRMAIRVLDELDLGKLMMLIHQLRRLIRSGPRRFKRRDLTDCQEDLAELVGERGLVSVGQQLAIAQRMQRSYHFLLPPR
ncbi:unnamed protein product [Laminaria digitata]